MFIFQAELIKNFRINNGLTQEELGKNFCRSKNRQTHIQVISDIERGVKSIPTAWVARLEEMGLDSGEVFNAASSDFENNWWDKAFPKE